jgi:WD40 repeat protein
MPGLAVVSAPAPFELRWSHELTDAVADLAWDGPGEALLAGSAAGDITRLDVQAGPQCRWQAHQGGLTRLALKPDGSLLASAGEDGRVLLWSPQHGALHAELADEGSWIEQLAWTPDGEVLAAAARKTVSLWRGSESLGVWYDARRQILAMAWAPDSRRLATAANKGLYLWRLGSEWGGNESQDGTTCGEPMQLLSFPGAPLAVAWQPNGKALAVGTQDGFLQVWRQAGAGRSAAKASQLTMRGYPGKVTCLAWHPSRSLLATAGGPDVVLWDLSRSDGQRKPLPLRGHRKTITTLAWSPDGRYLASGDRNGRLSLWDAGGQLLQQFTLHNEISVLRWRQDSSAFAVGDTGGRVQLFAGATHDDNSNSTPD